MGRLQEVVPLEALLHTLIIGQALVLHDALGHEQGTYLLVAVGTEFLPEAAQRIEVGVEGGFHLQLIVGKQLGILLHGLLVHHAVGVVLIVVILKLAARHGLVVDVHHHRVVLATGLHGRHGSGMHTGSDGQSQPRKK